MADGDDNVARPDSHGRQRQVQCDRAVRNSAGVLRPHALGEVLLELAHARALGHPAGKNRLGGGIGFLAAQQRLGHGYLPAGLRC